MAPSSGKGRHITNAYSTPPSRLLFEILCEQLKQLTSIPISFAGRTIAVTRIKPANCISVVNHGTRLTICARCGRQRVELAKILINRTDTAAETKHHRESRSFPAPASKNEKSVAGRLILTIDERPFARRYSAAATR